MCTTKYVNVNVNVNVVVVNNSISVKNLMSCVNIGVVIVLINYGGRCIVVVFFLFCYSLKEFAFASSTSTRVVYKLYVVFSVGVVSVECVEVMIVIVFVVCGLLYLFGCSMCVRFWYVFFMFVVFVVCGSLRMW